MAAYNDAMNWYRLGDSGTGLSVPRLKYLYHVNFYTPHYTTLLGNEARMLFKTVKTAELPKFALETELLNSWNVRIPITTKVIFEPISITFNDTQDNVFQKFLTAYMDIASGSFVQLDSNIRTGFKSGNGINFPGLKMLETSKPIIEKIEIIRFFGGERDNDGRMDNYDNYSKTTLWQPKIVDVQHDTLDYSSSEAITWTISLRYESVTYEDSGSAFVEGT